MIIGMPAAGKTTALAAATELLGWRVAAHYRHPVPHVVYDNLAKQLGRVRPEMGGTDALSMSIGPKAIEWVLSRPTDLLLAEGDRLAYDAFLDAAASVGTLELVWLDVAPDLARARALARNEKAQNLTWVKGRIRKVDNLIARRPHHRINASAPPDQVAEQVARVLAAPAPAGSL
jgi:hypothetical protein